MSVKPQEHIALSPISLLPVGSPLPLLPVGGPRAEERIRVAAIPDEIPPEIVKPSLCERVASVTEDTLRIAGFASFGGVAVWSGVTAGLTTLTIASSVVAGAFLTLHIIDKTCGRGNSATELLNRSVQWYATLQQEQRRLIAQQGGVVVNMRDLSQHEDAALEASGSLVQAGIVDTAKLGQTVVELQQGVAAMAPIQAQLQASLKSAQDENATLKNQLATFQQLFNSFQEHVQTVSKTIPELKSIQLSWDHSMLSFKENSGKILDGFKQLLTQLSAHSELIDSLKNQKSALEKQLADIQTEVNEMGANNVALTQENAELTETNKNINRLNTALQELGKKLDLDDSDLDQRTVIFQQEKADFKALVQTLQKATAASSNGPSSGGHSALLDQYQRETEQQLRQLEEGSL